MSLPDTGDVDLTGTCLMTFSGWPIWSCAATIQVHTISAVNIRISFFIDIALSPLKQDLFAAPPSLLQQLKTKLKTDDGSISRFAVRYCPGTFHSLPFRARASVDFGVAAL